MCGELDKFSTHSTSIEKPDTNEASSNLGVSVKSRAWDKDWSAPTLSLLELAANNDLDGFRKCVEEGFHKIYEEGPWYVRLNGARQMVLEQRTPAMIAALYGSLDVLKYIVKSYALCGGDIDQACGHDGTTALHCAAAGGSASAVEAVRILCDSGANVNVLDAHGKRPADLIVAPHRRGDVKRDLEELLNKGQLEDFYGTVGYDFPDDFDDCFLPSSDELGLFSAMDGEGAENVSSSTLSTGSLGSGLSSISTPSPSSSPKSPHESALKVLGDGNERVREYPVDPSLPDIKNSIYTTDEFRMYAFKIRPCSRAYSHDWTECPFVHPGENARRRDPRRYHYSCVPCPEFRKGACRRGDTCEYAHGVFECWLHPAQYRTRLCKDGTACNRRVCFFAHTAEELRPLYVSTGSAVPSPRSSAYMDMSLMSPPLAPGSPLMMPPYSPSHSVQSTMQGTPPMSPSSSAPSSLSGTWAHTTIPTLHLPGASLQASRLRAALIARNASVNDSVTSPEFDNQLMSDFQSLSTQSLSTQARLNAAVAASGNGITGPRAGKYRNLGLSVAPTNLEELFASESISSPSFSVHDSSHVSQFETHLQSQSYAQSHLFSPVSPRMQQLQAQQAALEAQLQSPTKAPSFSLGSLSRMSRGFDVERQGSREASSSSALAAARAAFAQRDKRSHSSRDLGTGVIWSEWGSPMGKPEWSIQKDDLSKLRKSSSFGFRDSEEPDLSWVQKLVKEGPLDTGSTAAPAEFCDDGSDNSQRDGGEISLLGSWIDKLNLDQTVA